MSYFIIYPSSEPAYVPAPAAWAELPGGLGPVRVPPPVEALSGFTAGVPFLRPCQSGRRSFPLCPRSCIFSLAFSSSALNLSWSTENVTLDLWSVLSVDILNQPW